MSETDQEWRDRKYPRVKESCDLKYHVIEDAVGERPDAQGGVSVNISGGGMCFSSGEALKPGSMVALEMSLSHLPTPVVSLGRVVWCEESEDRVGRFDVGVEFWWIGWADQEAQNQMLQFVRKKLEELGVDGTR
jgi:c-di-GMP-binding flagellar brake protein YcgR